MKTIFPFYYRLSEEEKINLFQDVNCFYVFDTNALLDIYRLGRDSASKVLELIKNYKDRIVIPRHVATEYHKNMLSVITELHSSYKVFLEKNKFDEILDKLSKSLDLDKYPSIKRKFHSHVQKSLRPFLAEIESENAYIDEQYKTWGLQSRISELLGGLVLDGFTSDELREIEKDGEERFKKLMPPGYKDASLKQENKYGDYIIWKEVLRFANSKQCSVIFVSRDLKEDWIEKSHGLNCGPRLELLEEFGDVSSGKFHICTLDNFITYANRTSKILDDPEIEEIKEVVDSYYQKDLLHSPSKNSMLDINVRKDKNVEFLEENGNKSVQTEIGKGTKASEVFEKEKS